MNHQIVRLQPGLHFVGTPIGSARDITLRALDVLASADILAAEDTRSLRRLLDIHGVQLNGRQVQSYHDHSGAGPQARLLSALQEGRSVAYASEAGMPMIADPGFELARAAVAAGHVVTSAPGPTAATTAMVLSGLPTDSFFFGGFLPSTRSARRTRLEALRDLQATLVFYESPRRIAETLKDAADVLEPSRQAVVARELTKKFEEVARGDLEALATAFAGRTVKGEIVLLIDRGSEKIQESGDMTTALGEAMAEMSVKDAVDLVSKAMNLPRRQVYQAALELTRKG